MPPSPQSATAKPAAPVCFEVLTSEAHVQDEQVTCVFWTHAGGRIALRMSIALARVFSIDLARRCNNSKAAPDVIPPNHYCSRRTPEQQAYLQRLHDEHFTKGVAITALARREKLPYSTLYSEIKRIQARRRAAAVNPVFKPGEKIL